MNATITLTLGAVMLGGMCLAVQAPINAALSRGIGGTIPAAAVSFGVGFLALVIVSLLTGQGAAFGRVGSVTPILLIGGAMGAYYVWAALWGVQTLGAVTMTGALILGQMVAAMVVDAHGFLGVPVQDISVTRLAAAGMVAGGVLLSRL
jgi:transporter family-2 protein